MRVFINFAKISFVAKIPTGEDRILVFDLLNRNHSLGTAESKSYFSVGVLRPKDFCLILNTFVFA
jgi:hypothetical protein